MVVNDVEIDRLAYDLVARHGLRAARVAAQRLNEMIDRKNLRDRDIWACVVHLIHEQQGPSPVWAERPYSVQPAPQMAAISRAAPRPMRTSVPLPEIRAMAAM
jgi:hypothetical protein